MSAYIWPHARLHVNKRFTYLPKVTAYVNERLQPFTCLQTNGRKGEEAGQPVKGRSAHSQFNYMGTMAASARSVDSS